MLKLLFGRELEEYEKELRMILDPGDAAAAGIPEAEDYAGGWGALACRSGTAQRRRKAFERSNAAGQDALEPGYETDLGETEGVSRLKRSFRIIDQLAATAAGRLRWAEGRKSGAGKRLGGIIEQVKKAVAGRRADRDEEQARPERSDRFDDAVQWMRMDLHEQCESALSRLAGGTADAAAGTTRLTAQDAHNRTQALQSTAQLMRRAAADTPQATDMQKISDFFQRDSRRYDGGFKRY